MFQGFKEFVSRGNAMEMAVGIVIGVAFSGVVDAVVDGLINPLVGGLFGHPNFDNVLSFEFGSATVMPGMILTQLVNFLLVAFAIYYIIVVPMNKLAEHRAKGNEPAEEEVEEDVVLLREIRDLLSAK